MTDTTSEKLEIEASRVLRAINADIEKAKAVQDQLGKSINSDKLTKEQIEREIKIALRKLEDAEKAGEMVKKQYQAYVERMIEMELDEKKVKERIGDAEIVLKNLDQEIQQTKADLITARANARKDVEDHIKAETANLKKLTKQSDEVEKQIAADREWLSATQKDIAAAKTELAAVEAKLADVQALIAGYQADLEATQDKAAKARVELETKLEAIKTAESDIASLNDKKAVLEQNIAKLAEEETIAGARLDALVAEIKAIEAKQFAIARREDHVKQREAYVKELFERAGATYEEFNPE